MNQDTTSQLIIPPKPEKKANWQLIIIIVGGFLLFLIVFYVFYKYIQYNNKKFKVLEQAIHNLTEKTNQSLPQPQPPSPLFMQAMQPPLQQPKPVSIRQPPIIQPPPPPTVVVVDSKVLDTELSEELKELTTATEPEGRIDEVEKEPCSTTT